MSERISIVVPNGTREKLKIKAAYLGQTQSAFSRKLITDGIKECEHEFVPYNEFGGNFHSLPTVKAVCRKCGFKP